MKVFMTAREKFPERLISYLPTCWPLKRKGFRSQGRACNVSCSINRYSLNKVRLRWLFILRDYEGRSRYCKLRRPRHVLGWYRVIIRDILPSVLLARIRPKYALYYFRHPYYSVITFSRVAETFTVVLYIEARLLTFVDGIRKRCRREIPCYKII